MEPMYYIGLDVHKRAISYCIKDGSGTIHGEGSVPATRFDLDRWMKTLPQPWTAAILVAPQIHKHIYSGGSVSGVVIVRERENLPKFLLQNHFT